MPARAETPETFIITEVGELKRWYYGKANTRPNEKRIEIRMR